jgi:chromosome segregation protein
LNAKSTIQHAEEHLAEKIAEYQSLNVEIDEQEKLPTYKELNATITQCQAEITAMGNVNQKAIDQYNIELAEIEKFVAERKRLEQERDNLITVMEEITSRKKAGLLQVFDAVNDNFGRIYAEITGGGEAELILENPDKPFEGGLIIKARPPGKCALNIDAISGGEKSITTLALLFALQQYDPSPFYVLDEIDMHLDPLNAATVAKMIKRNSKVTQIIVISLYKDLLKEADHVYGVTIQRHGITDIVGNVNISELPELEARGRLPAGSSDTEIDSSLSTVPAIT